jgi:uncharacterized delta-60 repeat protein
MRQSRKFSIAIVLFAGYALAAVPTMAAAAAGDLDASFGVGGKVIIDIGINSDDIVNALAIDASGNAYIAGSTGPLSNTDFAIIKLDTNGKLVPGFGAAGKVVIDIGTNSEDVAWAITTDPAGNVYVAGTSNSAGSFDFTIVKLDSSGALVPGFGIGGKVLIDIGTKSNDTAFGILRDAGGNLYIAGSSDAAGSVDFVVVKLDANGNLVPGFGVGGKAIVDIGTNSVDIPRPIVMDGTGNLYIAGLTGTGVINDFALIKLDSSGALVPGFGVGGKVVVDLGSDDRGTALARDATGNLFVAGFTGPPGLQDIAVVKLDATGTLVPGFGVGGKSIIDLGGAEIVEGIALNADGSMYIGTSTNTGASQPDFAAVKLDGAGNRVPAFGTGGAKIVDLNGGSVDILNALALDPSGRIYLAGYTRSGALQRDFAVVRLLAASPPVPALHPSALLALAALLTFVAAWARRRSAR